MSGLRMGMDLSMRPDLKQVLAPRMIQSMEILQLPIADLQAKIEKELQENPFLEQKEKHGEQDETPAVELDQLIDDVRRWRARGTPLVSLLTTPLVHATAVHQANTAFAVGGTIVLLERGRTDGDTICTTIVRERPSVLEVVGDVLMRRIARALDVGHQMRREQDTDAKFAVSFSNQVEHLLTSKGIEAGGRLVQEHDGWIMHQCLAELHALLHARRVAADRAIAFLEEARVAQGVRRSRPRRIGRESAELRHVCQELRGTHL